MRESVAGLLLTQEAGSGVTQFLLSVSDITLTICSNRDMLVSVST